MSSFSLSGASIAMWLWSGFYIFMLLIPGFMISRIVALKDHLFLYSLSFSLALYCVIFAICLLLKLDPDFLFGLYLSAFLVLLFFAIRKKQQPISVSYRHGLIFIIILIGVAVYQKIAGIYHELPADIFKHMEFYQAIFNQLVIHDQLPNMYSLDDNFSKAARYWYHIGAYLAELSNLHPVQIALIQIWVNSSFFIFGIYCFAHFLFKPFIDSTIKLTAVSVLSACFVCLHMGIDVFSFVRYYAIAPVILNYLVYFAAVVCLYQFLRQEINWLSFISFCGIFIFTTAVIHIQEALFIICVFVMIGLVLLWGMLIKSSLVKNMNLTRLSLLSALGFIAIIALLFFSYRHPQVFQPFIPKIISLHDLYAAFPKDWLILNPKFQGYQVLTHWGLWISLLYVLCFRLFKGQSYIHAMMLLPIFTVFNPFFVDLFLHYTNEHVVWRLLYLLPIHFVAAYLTISFLSTILYGSLMRKMLASFALIMIYLMLFPWNVGSINLPYSRIYTLDAVESENSPAHWQDLLAQMQTIDSAEKIITDPVTGYLLTALTKHINYRFKFLPPIDDYAYIFDHYDQDSFNHQAGRLMIVNLRDGGMSQTGAISRHWPADVLKMKQYYPDNLLSFIDKNPQIFKPVWSQDRITIYQIQTSQ